MKFKPIPVLHFVLYDIIINLLGNLSFWYQAILKDLIMVVWGAEFEYDIDVKNYHFYNYFAFGQVISSLVWTYMLKLISEKNVILISLIAQALTYLLNYYYYDNFQAILWIRVLQGLFDVLNSVGKSFVFEFCDMDYIKICFTLKGFIAIVMGNAIPALGNTIYEHYEKDFQACCWVMFIFSLFVAGTFYVAFYLLPYSDNT